MKFSGERFIPGALSDSEITTEHLQRYNSVIDIIKNKIVLDVASGEGYGSSIMAKYATNVYGVDISSEAVEQANYKYSRDNLSFIEASVEDLPFDDEFFDVVISFETIEHVSEELQYRFLKQIKRVLKKDGILIISTPNKKIYSDTRNYKNEFHIKEFYENDFHVFLKQYFIFVSFYYQRFEIASIIDNKNSTELNIISDNNNIEDNAKYLIAICSDIEQTYSIETVTHEQNNHLNKLISRIIQVQDEVEKLSVWGKGLEEEVRKRDNYIIEQNAKVEELSTWGQSLNSELAKRDSKISEQSKRVEELSIWGQSLNSELDKRDIIISEQSKRVEELSIWGQSLNSEISKRDIIISEQRERVEDLLFLNKNLEDSVLQKSRLIQSINEKLRMNDQLLETKTAELEKQGERLEENCRIIESSKNKILELLAKEEKLTKEINRDKQTIHNQSAHIEQLLEKERCLDRIYNSRGWKCLDICYRIENTLIPVNSIQRNLFKSMYFFFKNIVKVVNHINTANIKKAVPYILKGDFKNLSKKILSYLEKFKPYKKVELKLYNNSEQYSKIIFTKSVKPLVSIIIPVYNQWKFTYSCLQSILDNSEGIDYEVIIADDLSNDETKDISSFVENIKVVRNKENLGFLKNCNNAARKARGKYILFLNNDTNVQKDWLKYLIDLIDTDSNIGMVGSKLVYADGRLQEAGGIIWNDASGWNYGRLDDPEKPEYNYVKEVDYISGAGIMIRSDLWRKIGGFDERYVPAYYEDSDLAFEVRKHGYKVVYQPKSVIVHFEGISHGTNENSGIKSYQIENKEKFYKKWRDTLHYEHFSNAENIFLACDRSKNKKTILVVDHYVPHYDKDAGGRCTYQYIKLFKEIGLKVVFIGDNFYRHEPYTNELQQMGVEVIYGNWYVNSIQDWLKENGKYFDYVYLNRPHISIKYINNLKKYSKAKIIYFGHDLHYLRELRNYDIEKNDDLLKSASKWKEIEFELFNKSDVVYVVGNYEQKVIQSELPCKIVRNIPLYIYDKYSPISKGTFKERKDILFVGGFNHKPNYDGVMWFVNEIYPKILGKCPGVKFYIVGSNPPDDIKKLQCNNIFVTGFVPETELDNFYRTCKIVVAPLRYGAGVKGKIVEAIYNQVPVVTTSIGAEGLIDAHKVLTIVDDADLFAKSVIELYQNNEKLEHISEESYKYINSYFMKENAREVVLSDVEIKN